MLTISQARKKLGKQGEKLSDDELQKEIDTSEFLASMILDFYKSQDHYLKNKTKNALQ